MGNRWHRRVIRTLTLICVVRITLSRSLIGGTLARPSERFPVAFRSQFWIQYPYFLPCFVISIVIAVGFIITALFFTETVQTMSSPLQPSRSREKHPSLSELNTYPVVISVTNHLLLAFIYGCLINILPLFFATPIALGGTGFDPAQVGYVLGAYFAFSAFFLVTFSTKLIHSFGERRIFICSISSILIVCFLLPLVNLVAWHFGTNSLLLWVGIIVIAVPRACSELAHVCIYVFITGASPSKHSIGATNGLAQMIAICAHTISPAMFTSIFAFSVQTKLLGGYAVYVLLFFLTLFAMWMSLKLPLRPEPVWEED